MLRITILLGALLCGIAQANLASADSLAQPRCIGLVLGGGGARGAAHIGVLEVLEQQRVPICRIAGTSMGAIVGGLYAAGYRPAEIKAILAAIDWQDVLSDDPARTDFPMRRKDDTLRYLLDFRIGLRDGTIRLPRGVIQGQKLLTLLRRLTLHTWRTESFDDLPIPFRAVATDIVTGEAVVFDHGDLALAIRASMSVPAAFAPIRVDGRLLVDGGIVNNVPVDVVRQMGADRVIAVDVSAALLGDSELDSPIAITMQMLDVLMKQRTAQVLSSMNPGDIRIIPQLGDIGSASFDRATEAVEPGAEATRRVLPSLQELAVSEAQYAALSADRERRDFDSPLLAFLEVVTDRSRTAGYVARELEGFAGKTLDPLRLESRVNAVHGQGNYELISWELEERNGETGVRVIPVDKSWGPDFLTFGLQISDDFAGRNSYQLGVEYTRTGLNRWGGEWRSRGEIGRITGLRSEFFQPGGDRGQLYALPYLEYRSLDQDVRALGTVLADYRVRRALAGVDLGYEPVPVLRLYAGVFRGEGQARRKVGNPGPLDRFDESSGGFRLGLTRDTLDDADFPAKGGRTDLLLVATRAAFGADGRGEVFDLSWDHAFGLGPHRLLLGTRLHTVWGTPSRFDSRVALGGFANLSGYSERQLIDDHAVLFRAVYYRRLGDQGQLFSVPAYIGGSIESGAVYEHRADLFELDGLVLAGSLFVGIDSPFGPVVLAYGRNNDNASSFYLNFGSLLRPRL